MERILARGRRLQQKMDEALGDDPWEELHGPHAVPKTSYINPFQAGPGQDMSPDREQDRER